MSSIMRTRRSPGLDAETHQYEDLYGPLDSDTVGVYNATGVDRMIGEGIVELPDGSRDPLDILLEDRVAALFDDDAEDPDAAPITASLVEPTRQRRVVAWFAPGYAPRADRSLRRRPSIRLDTFISNTRHLDTSPRHVYSS